MLKSLATTLLAGSALFAPALAATTHEFDWTVSWKTVNPDGLKDRIVVAINDEWPLPVIRVNKGDRVIATVTNALENPRRNSSIHFHGLFQNGTNDMDGPTWITQCPGAPNTTFVYNFTVEQNGTYWYHTHVDKLYPDGYRQMFIVDGDEPWFEDLYEEELAFSLSDWYHELTQDISDDTFMSLYNPTGAEPVPQSLLLNDSVNSTFYVKPNTTYRLRVANTGAFSAFIFWIQGHNLTVVEADGVYTEPKEVQSVHIAAAQRYSFLFTTGPEANAAYQMVQVADSSLYDVVPPDLQLNVTNWLVTSDEAARDWVYPSEIFEDSGIIVQDDSNPVDAESFTSDNLDYFDDATLVPYDHEPLLQNPTKVVNLVLTLTNLYDGKNYAFFNDISWTPQRVPTLYSVLSAPDDETANNKTIYGHNINPVVLQHNEVVELIVNNFDSGQHPFHLHGHAFQVAIRADSRGSDSDDDYFPYDADAGEEMYDPPMRRDTLVVKPYSHFVLRFRADNPGVWIFHCHIDWHLTQGLGMIFIEAPTQIRQNYVNRPLPQNHIDTCTLSGLPYEGNAGANTENFFDLSNQNLQVKSLPDGFTARGIVALVFSVICAFVGMGFLVWYGLTDIDAHEDPVVAAQLISDFADEDITAQTPSENRQVQ